MAKYKVSVKIKKLMRMDQQKLTQK